MKRHPRFAVENTETTIQCGECHGKGYGSVAGFDGNERVDCTNCDGFGGWEYVAIDMEMIATVAEIETYLGAPVAPASTPMPLPVHPGMTVEFFDTGVRRAFANDLSISRTSRDSVVAVSSTTDADTYYTVTRETCTCVGHERVGRCLHRAFAIWHWWVCECDAVAVAAHPAPVEINLPVAA